MTGLLPVGLDLASVAANMLSGKVTQTVHGRRSLCAAVDSG
jgi:hypothetical protein